MHPYLFDLNLAGFHLRPPTYGVLLAVAFSVGYFESLRRASLLNENLKHVENLFLIVVIGSVVGSRLFHVLFEEFDYYRAHPEKILAVWEGGYTFYGAMLSSLFCIYLYTRRHKIPYLQFADIAAPTTALGLFFGRIGCFAAGCCWGRRATVPWAVTFNHPETFANVRNAPLHPTQLYEAFGGILIFFYLLWLFKRRKYEGQIFFHGLLAYAILRFIIEFYRGDDYRGYVFGGVLSYSQLVSLFLVPFAIAGMILYSRRPPQGAKPT